MTGKTAEGTVFCGFHIVLYSFQLNQRNILLVFLHFGVKKHSSNGNNPAYNL